MTSLFLECSARAALLVVATAIVLHALRVKPAAARHTIWTGVLLLMLLLPAWTAWGPRASLRLLPPLQEKTAGQSIEPPPAFSTIALPPNAATLEIPQPAARPRFVLTWQGVLLGVYLLGLCLLLLRLAIGTLRAHKLVRQSKFRDGRRTSAFCAAPVTVGFFHPAVILPEQWTKWPPAQLDAVLTHEGEHARRRDSLVQWLALLNRALFWFHPAAWWLERHLSALAEEACDDVVLARGHNPREYSEYLLAIARSVVRSGARLSIPGMAMPGSGLPRRIRQIIEAGPAPRISRARMACVALACTITGVAFATATLGHARPNLPAQTATKFILGDLKIQGDVHDGDAVRDRVLKAWKDREYDDADKLADDVMRLGVREDFQDRGYFEVVAVDPVPQPLGLRNGKQRILVIAPVTEGEQFRLGSVTIQNADAGRALSIPAQTLRDQFSLHDGDLFDVSELRTAIEKVTSLYGTVGHSDVTLIPSFAIDHASHRINLTIRVAEGELAASSPTSSASLLAQTKPAQPGKNGVGTPTCSYCPAPQYSEEARKAKFHGRVIVSAVIGTDGRATNIKVLRNPGLGLGEKALADVATWRFKPAPGPDGKPVPVITYVEVDFDLPKEIPSSVPPAAPRAPSPQGSAAPPPTKLTFDVASIKPNTTGGDICSRVAFSCTRDMEKPGVFTAVNQSLRDLMGAAYALTPAQVRIISGAPKWIDSERFDIQATTGGDTRLEQKRMMLQSLLADRFRLALHHETRQGPIYALVLAKAGKTGPGLTQHSGTAGCIDLSKAPRPPKLGDSLCGGILVLGRGGLFRVTANNTTMATLAEQLGGGMSGDVDRAVLDRTGLSGEFDVTLEYTPRSQIDSGAAASDPTAPPSLTTALQEQLGLKLVPQIGPVDVLVIDHVEQPSEN